MDFWGEPRYDPYSNAYTPGWRDHPNSSYGYQQYNPYGYDCQEFYPEPQSFYQQGAPQQYNPAYEHILPKSNPNLSTEAMLKNLTQHFATRSQTRESSIKNIERLVESIAIQHTSIKDLKRQVGQLADAVTELVQRKSNSLPSQTAVNPRENVPPSAEEEDECEMEETADRPASPLTATRCEVLVIPPPRGETNRDPAACLSISTASSPPRGNDYRPAVDRVPPSDLPPRPGVRNSSHAVEVRIDTYFRPEVLSEEEYFLRYEEEWSDDEEECCDRENTPETITPTVPDPLEAAYDEFVRLNSFPLVSLQPVVPLLEASRVTQRPKNNEDIYEAFSDCIKTVPLVILRTAPLAARKC